MRFSCRPRPTSGSTTANCLHDHFKTTLVGHSVDNTADDTHLTVTYHHNLFSNLVSGIRTRFGEIHVLNNYFHNIREYGVVAQMGADVLVEKNVFENVAVSPSDDYYSVTTTYLDPQPGRVRILGSDFPGSGPVNVTMDSLWTPPYAYDPGSLSGLEVLVEFCAGAGVLDLSQLSPP